MEKHEVEKREVAAKRLMSVDELSRYLAMPRATIYTYVSLKKIPAECIRRIGRSLRFEVAAVDAWVSDSRDTPGESSRPSKKGCAPTPEPTRQGAV